MWSVLNPFICVFWLLIWGTKILRHSSLEPLSPAHLRGQWAIPGQNRDMISSWSLGLPQGLPFVKHVQRSCSERPADTFNHTTCRWSFQSSSPSVDIQTKSASKLQVSFFVKALFIYFFTWSLCFFYLLYNWTTRFTSLFENRTK